MAPSDENELGGALATALSESGPTAFRFPRGTGTGIAIDSYPSPWPIGKARWLKASDEAKVSILALGPMVAQAQSAAEQLAARGITVNVLDMRFIKPLDEEAILSLAKLTDMAFITLEEGVLAGGFGAAVLELLNQHHLRSPVIRLGLPDQFIEHGSVAKQYAAVGLDAQGIIKAVQTLLPTDHKPKRQPNEISH